MNWRIPAILITTLTLLTAAPGCGKNGITGDPVNSARSIMPTATVTITVTATQTVNSYQRPTSTPKNTPVP